MDSKTFEEYRDLIRHHAGICLAPGKEALVTSRIAKRIRELSLGSEMEYLRYIQAEESVEELTRLIDLISTNVTHFLREPVHFDLISQQMRSIWQKEPKPMRFWSAACSTGQEPYTLAMFVHEIAEEMGIPLSLSKILATDISSRVLAKASEGVYSSTEMETLPTQWIAKYFTRSHGPGQYVISDKLKKIVSFKRLNLSTIPYPMQGPFDTILCRNVMIYFDKEVRSRIVTEVGRLLAPKGLFMVGHSESLSGLDHSFSSPSPTVYQKG